MKPVIDYRPNTDRSRFNHCTNKKQTKSMVLSQSRGMIPRTSSAPAAADEGCNGAFFLKLFPDRTSAISALYLIHMYVCIPTPLSVLLYMGPSLSYLLLLFSAMNATTSGPAHAAVRTHAGDATSLSRRLRHGDVLKPLCSYDHRGAEFRPGLRCSEPFHDRHCIFTAKFISIDI